MIEIKEKEIKAVLVGLITPTQPEALTKEFYAQLYNWYLWAVEPSTGVTFPNVVGNKHDDTDNISIKHSLHTVGCPWMVVVRRIQINSCKNIVHL